MSWREFEQLVGEAFRQRGYQISENSGGGPDGGVDLVLRKGSEKWLVQCKQWRATQVGVVIVRELYGLIAAEGATGGGNEKYGIHGIYNFQLHAIQFCKKTR
jgi:restriction system protein